MAQELSTTITNLLIEEVDQQVHASFEQGDSLLSMMEREEPDPTNSIGKRVVIEVEPNASEGWVAEGADYPTGDADVRVALNVKYTRVRKVGRFSGDVKLHDENGAKSIAKSITRGVSRATTNLRTLIDQHLFGDGTGKIAVVSAYTNPTTTCTVAGGTFGAQKLPKRKRVQFYDSTVTNQRVGTVGTGALTVSSSSLSSQTVTFGSNIPSDVVATDVIVPEGSANNVLKGLDYIIASSGTYFSQSRTTFPTLRATVAAAGGASLSQALLDKTANNMIYKTGVDGNANDSKVVLWSPAQRQAYVNNGYELKTFPGAGGKLDLGFDSEITVSGMKTMVNVHCPDDTVYYLRPKLLRRAQLAPIGIRRPFNGQLLAPETASSGRGYSENWLFHLGADMEVFSPEPYMFGKLSGLSTTSLPSGNA